MGVALKRQREREGRREEGRKGGKKSLWPQSSCLYLGSNARDRRGFSARDRTSLQLTTTVMPFGSQAATPLQPPRCQAAVLEALFTFPIDNLEPYEGRDSWQAGARGWQKTGDWPHRAPVHRDWGGSLSGHPHHGQAPASARSHSFPPIALTPSLGTSICHMCDIKRNKKKKKKLIRGSTVVLQVKNLIAVVLVTTEARVQSPAQFSRLKDLVLL